MGSILNASMSGMSAAQAGLQTTQHNVSNANTTGYTRQKIAQTSSLANSTGVGYIGTGTQVSSVTRLYDQFLTQQVDKTQSTLSALKATSNQMDTIDQLLADPTAGVSPALDDFFSAAQQVSSYPSSVAARQTMVSAAQVVTDRLATMGNTINSLNEQINLQMQTDADSLNSYAKQLADLNNQITNSGKNGYAPNDLLDKRDQVINEIGKLADVTTTEVKNTSLSGSSSEFSTIQVYIGKGYLLVSDSGAQPVTTSRSATDPTQLTFNVGSKQMAAGDVTGGSLGGLISFRSDTLSKAQNSLGQVAYALASSFNEQHKTGMDLQGNLGENFFNIKSDTVDASGNPLMTAVGSPATSPALNFSLETPSLNVISDPNNQPGPPIGTIQDFSLAGYNKTNVTNSDYKLAIDLSGNYTLTRMTDGKTWPTAPATETTLAGINNLLASDPQGFTLDTTNTPNVDSSYMIRPMAKMAESISVNPAIVGDPKLVAAGLSVKAGLPTNTNAGTMTAVVNRLTPSGVTNYTSTIKNNLPVTLTFDGTNLTGFSATGAASVEVIGTNGIPVTGSPFGGDSVPYYSGASYSVGGIVFTTSGQPSTNDQLYLQKNDSPVVGVGDSSNLLQLAKLQTAKVVSGAATVGGTYAQMVADVGNDAATAKSSIDSQQSLYNLAVTKRDSYSGVNLDEEAANLIYFQQMYQANAKSLQSAQKLFDTLISIMP